MICDYCLNDVWPEDIAYYDGDAEISSLCWRNEKIKKRVLDRKKRYEEIGHTGEDMCGCSMCARRYEIEHDD